MQESSVSSREIHLAPGVDVVKFERLKVALTQLDAIGRLIQTDEFKSGFKGLPYEAFDLAERVDPKLHLILPRTRLTLEDHDGRFVILEGRGRKHQKDVLSTQSALWVGAVVHDDLVDSHTRWAPQDLIDDPGPKRRALFPFVISAADIVYKHVNRTIDRALRNQG